MDQSLEVFIADCRHDDEWNLFQCGKGTWYVNTPHDQDEVSSELHPEMEVTGGLGDDINTWFTNGADFKKTGSYYRRGEDPIYDFVNDAFGDFTNINAPAQDITFIPGVSEYCTEGYAVMESAFMLFGDCQLYDDSTYIQFACNDNGDEMQFQFYSDDQCSSSQLMRTVATSTHYLTQNVEVHCPAAGASDANSEWQCQFADSNVWACDSGSALHPDFPIKSGLVIPVGLCLSAQNNPIVDQLYVIPALMDGDPSNDDLYWMVHVDYCTDVVSEIFDNPKCEGAGDKVYDQVTATNDKRIPIFEKLYGFVLEGDICFEMVECATEETTRPFLRWFSDFLEAIGLPVDEIPGEVTSVLFVMICFILWVMLWFGRCIRYCWVQRE